MRDVASDVRVPCLHATHELGHPSVRDLDGFVLLAAIGFRATRHDLHFPNVAAAIASEVAHA